MINKHIIYPFKVFNSMFTDIALYNHHHNFKTFFSLWEKKKKPIISSPTPLSDSDNHKSIFNLHRFAYSGYFIGMGSYNMWYFVTVFFFYLASFQVSSTLHHVLVFYFFLLLNNILAYGYAHFIFPFINE